MENINKSRGDISEMQLFNNLILDLDLVDLPFNGRKFTWSNMQVDPLLVKLDWVFTSLLGGSPTLQLQLIPSLGPSLIIPLFLSLLEQIFPKAPTSDLKTIGLRMLIS